MKSHLPAPHPAQLRAVSEFRARFGADPTCVAIAPGRVNLIGEHTDYTGGFALPMAIDRVCAVAAGPAADPALGRLYSVEHRREWTWPAGVDLDDTGVVWNDVDPHPQVGPGEWAPGHWTGYVAGVLHYTSKAAPMHAVISSDVPFGSGLSSSAALEVSLAYAALTVAGGIIEPRTVAGQCMLAEHRFPVTPCGVMDQLAAVLGEEGCALLLDCRSESVKPVPIPARARIVVLNTGVRHTLAGGEYAKRRVACERAQVALGCSLRDVLPSTWTARKPMSADDERLALHVIRENMRTLHASACLQVDDLPTFGRLMNASHESLRDDFRVSCAELDAFVDIARQVAGVWGARMTGGGFGGCAIALATPDAAARLIADGPRLYRERTGRDGQVFTVRPSAGAWVQRLA